MDLRILGMPGCWDFGSSHKAPLVVLCASYHPQLPGRWPRYLVICTKCDAHPQEHKNLMIFLEKTWHAFCFWKHGILHGLLKQWLHTAQHLRLIVPYFMLLLGHSLQFLSLRFDPLIWRGCLARGEYYLCGVDLSKAVCWCYPCWNLAKEKYTRTHTCHIAMDIMKRKHICKWFHFHRYVRLLEGT